MTGRRPVPGPKKPAGEAKPDVCALSDGKAGAYCTVRLVLILWSSKQTNDFKSMTYFMNSPQAIINRRIFSKSQKSF